MMNWKEKQPHAHDLMELHVEALFTHDQNMRLRSVNEPWPGEASAPRFFLGRTTDGTAICRFRHDVPEKLIAQLQELCADEPSVQDFQTKPKHLKAYKNLLQGERISTGPCYLIPQVASPSMQVISLTRNYITEWLPDDFEWLVSEIDYAQPCVALVSDNQVVSICRSVRITSQAHEAGLETLEPYRGRGYATAVVAGWATAVRQIGRLPLYSTFMDNMASQSVARKLGLSFYGVNFMIF
ncbi:MULTISPECIES: kasugamycin N-acetyltransferase AAC(2')-IIb [Paenibacillus]|uniref:kasugamycin N-acetyltransferase AAC(2')-IIb n=1 Tax=Paenibacillus TaxID=44249 RepID=UPI00333EF3D1